MSTTTKTYKADALASLIRYHGDSWRTQNKAIQSKDPFTDAFVDRYDGKTFVFTCVGTGSESADITFTGSEFGLYGASRANHGTFTVLLDGAPYQTVTLDTPTTDDGIDNKYLQRLLWSWKGEEGKHTVSIQNTPTEAERAEGKQCFDIDYVTWTSTVRGNDLTIQDTDSNHFTYDPNWYSQTGSGDLPAFDQSTGRLTRTNSASFTFNFTGDRVLLYGPNGNLTGGYQVQLDGGPTQSFNGSRGIDFDNHAQQVLYAMNGLGGGEHSVVLTKAGGDGKLIAVDYAVVSDNQGGGSTSRKLPAGVIAGISIGGFVVLALIGCVIWLFLRMKEKKRKSWVDLVSADAPFSLKPEMRTGTVPPPSYGHEAPAIAAHHQASQSMSYPSSSGYEESDGSSIFQLRTPIVGPSNQSVPAHPTQLQPGMGAVSLEPQPRPPAYRKGRT
ncbi:hypothetical protein DL96DRAFT_1582458 [Flagelloscypha sp. PMI_526]|nr:hypothetical protein DL96DRAFT_1582458 [Flagelloscypha sp. PMI_526]